MRAWFFLICLTLVPSFAQATPPSVAVINLDDADYRLFYLTPRLTFIAAGGMQFSNAFVPLPVCGPSRASLLTGQHAHNSRIRSNGGDDDIENDEVWVSDHKGESLADWLTPTYLTVRAGKGINGVDPTNLTGWDQSIPAEFRNASNAPKYWLDLMTDRAVASIQNSTEPVFLYFAPATPHGPVIPSPQYAGLWGAAALPMPPSFNEADVSDKRWKFHLLPLLDAGDIDYVTVRHRRRLEMMESVTDSILRIASAIGPNGYVFVTSDNGQFEGQHRETQGKGAHFEEAIHVPLVVYGPGLAGKQSSALVYGNVDLASTISELTGVTIPQTDGRSMVPLFSDPDSAWRNRILIEYPPRFQGMRGKARKFVFVKGGERELYNINADPYELSNRCTLGDATCGADSAAWTQQLAQCAGTGCWDLEVAP